MNKYLSERAQAALVTILSNVLIAFGIDNPPKSLAMIITICGVALIVAFTFRRPGMTVMETFKGTANDLTKGKADLPEAKPEAKAE